MTTRKACSFMAFVLLCGFCMGNQSCDTQKQVSSSGAQQVTLSSKIPKNSRGLTVEQQNIEDRIKVTTDPTKIMWIHLVSLDGNIIKRMPVRNKVTSSGKRLEPRHYAQFGPSSGMLIPGNSDSYYATDEFIQPDGTYGDSDPYIYWFDSMGRYNQWGTAGGLGYLLTDYPIDLENQIDKVTGLYRVHKEAAEWQKLQEEQLKAKELKSGGK